MKLKTLVEWDAQVGEKFAYEGLKHSIWEFIKDNKDGTADLKNVNSGVISKRYPIFSGRFSRVRVSKPIGYIGVDAEGNPVRPVKAGGYIGRPATKLPPRIYTTPEKAKQYHGAVDAKPVYME